MYQHAFKVMSEYPIELSTVMPVQSQWPILSSSRRAGRCRKPLSEMTSDVHTIVMCQNQTPSVVYNKEILAVLDVEQIAATKMMPEPSRGTWCKVVCMNDI